MATLSITWLGHATFLLTSPAGKRILFDPWVTGNPTSHESTKRLGSLDLILITHGHSDHTTDAVAIGRSSGAQTVAPYELAGWLERKGLQKVTGMNPGGTLEALGLSITMVPAMHSSSEAASVAPAAAASAFENAPRANIARMITSGTVRNASTASSK